MQIAWTTQQRKISDLKPFGGNPRRLTDEQAKYLLESLRKFNLVEIPAVDQNNRILAGHMRIQALKQLGRGDETIDVRVPSRDLTEDEAKEYLLRSNKNTGEWDFELLSNFTEDMLKKTGFDSKELDRIFKVRHTDDEDDAPDLVPTDIKIGDIFKLGEHYLMCGDSTQIKDAQTLMRANQADMIFEELLKLFKSLIKKEENGNSTVWRFGRESNYKHPTQSP